MGHSPLIDAEPVPHDCSASTEAADILWISSTFTVAAASSTLPPGGGNGDADSDPALASLPDHAMNRALRTLPAAVAAVAVAVLPACRDEPAATASSPSTTVATVADPVPPSTTGRSVIDSIDDCSPVPQLVGAPQPGRQEAVGPVVVFLEDGVNEVDGNRVLDGVRAAQRYVSESLGGFRFDEPICVDVRGGSGPNSPTMVGVVHGANHIVIYTGARPLAGAPSWLLSHVAAHEYAHFWQKDIGSPRDGAGPVWLLEGSAELIGYLAVSGAELTTYESTRTYALRRVTSDAPSLPAMERRTEEFSYPVALLATELLTASRGAGSLRDYWRGLSRGMPWEEAFTAAFGERPEDFYPRFEDHRRRGFPR
jgi:hypothetical protein